MSFGLISFHAKNLKKTTSVAWLGDQKILTETNFDFLSYVMYHIHIVSWSTTSLRQFLLCRIYPLYSYNVNRMRTFCTSHSPTGQRHEPATCNADYLWMVVATVSFWKRSTPHPLFPVCSDPLLKTMADLTRDLSTLHGQLWTSSILVHFSAPRVSIFCVSRHMVVTS